MPCQHKQSVANVDLRLRCLRAPPSSAMRVFSCGTGDDVVFGSRSVFMAGDAGENKHIVIGDGAMVRRMTTSPHTTASRGSTKSRRSRTHHMPRAHVYRTLLCVQVADRCVVLPGVRVGRAAVLGSGAIAHKDAAFPPGSTWLGACVHVWASSIGVSLVVEVRGSSLV
jgi:acetyltransferase-like isoleucine patch superfamily enzyme